MRTKLYKYQADQRRLIQSDRFKLLEANGHTQKVLSIEKLENLGR